MTLRPSTLTTGNDRGFSRLWTSGTWSTVVPLLLAIVMAPLLAYLLVSEKWIFVVLLLVAIPTVILIQQYPFASIVIWMAVMPWFPFRGNFKYIYYSAHRMLIPVGIGLAILSRMLIRTKQHSKLHFGLADWAMAAFCALGTVAIFVTGLHWKTVFVLQDQFLVPFTAYWLVRLTNARGKDLQRIIPLMLVILVAECIIGFVSWFAPAALPEIWHFGTLGSRTAGTFGQPAIYALVLITFMVLVYHDAMNRSTGWFQTVEILAYGLGCVSVFFTFTRGAWLAGLVALVVIAFTYPKPTLRLAACIVLGMALLSTNVLSTEFAHAADRLHRSEAEAGERIVLANAGKQMFLARPVLGWGFANYDRYDRDFLDRVGDYVPNKWDIKKGTSHHTYLTILAEMGIVGFSLYALPIVQWLVNSVKAMPRLPKRGFWSRQLLPMIWASAVAHVIIAQDLDMRFFYYALTMFWITMGFVANLVEPILTQRPVS